MSFEEEIKELVKWDRKQRDLIRKKYPYLGGCDNSAYPELRELLAQSNKKALEISKKYKGD